jgi:hypothetical protein
MVRLAKLSEEFNDELTRSLNKNPDLYQKMLEAYESVQWTFIHIASKTLYIKSISFDAGGYQESIAPLKVEKAECIANLAQKICGAEFMANVAKTMNSCDHIAAAFEKLDAPTLAMAFKPV